MSRVLRVLLCSPILAWMAGAGAQETDDPSATLSPGPCSLSAADRAWIERALEAWRFAAPEIAGIERVPSSRAIFFDAACVLTSGDALTGADASRVSWTAATHAGSIALPDGKHLPIGVASFAAGEESERYFVMSTPSVWEAGGVGKGSDLEATMVGVLLHEASHVAQLGPYGTRLGALIERHALPDSFNDDAVEERFKTTPEFVASVQHETQLFHAAASAPDDTEARLAAYEAREAMRARQTRWMIEKDAYLVEAEDLWLTFEGAGQWVAYQWLVHPKGAAQAPPDVLRRFARGPWSQTQGFALFLALDRIAGPVWKRHAYGDGARTALEILDAALAE
jgi:hypothetical protein